jgi:chemotaxis signal transduction protein
MRVKVVRTPGELRDEIGHKIMVQKDWRGSVIEVLDEAALAAHGFHPKRSEQVYLVLFDEWEQHLAVPAVNLVEILPEEDVDPDQDEDDED